MRVQAALALALAAVACATVGEQASPPGPPPFEGVKRIALVRWVEDPAAPRAKDALDALGESLGARGYATRAVEVGPRTRDRRDLAGLFTRIHARIAGGTGREAYGRGTDRAGGEAAAALAALGVDAVAMMHRFEGPLPPAMSLDSPFAPRTPGSPFDPPRSARPYRPIGALSLVSRSGDVVWFEWGTPPPEDPSAPANAAEAIDAVLRALAGDEYEP